MAFFTQFNLVPAMLPETSTQNITDTESSTTLDEEKPCFFSSLESFLMGAASNIQLIASVFGTSSGSTLMEFLQLQNSQTQVQVSSCLFSSSSLNLLKTAQHSLQNSGSPVAMTTYSSQSTPSLTLNTLVSISSLYFFFV